MASSGPEFVGPKFQDPTADEGRPSAWARILAGLFGLFLIGLGLSIFLDAHVAQRQNVSGTVTAVFYHRGHVYGLFPSGYDLELNYSHAPSYDLEPGRFLTRPPVPRRGDRVFLTVDRSSGLVLALTTPDDVTYVRDAYAHPDRLLWQQRGAGAAAAAFGGVFVGLAILRGQKNDPATTEPGQKDLDERIEELTSDSPPGQP